MQTEIQGGINSMENVIFLNPKNKDKLIESASLELSQYLVNQADKGVPLEALIGLLEIYKHNMTIEHANIEDI